MTMRENKELENRNVLTLNLSTSSMRAVLPEVTQVWKNEGATLDRKVMVRTIIIAIASARGAKLPQLRYDHHSNHHQFDCTGVIMVTKADLTPSACEVMLVPCALLLAAMIRNVPNRRTSRCYEVLLVKWL